MRSAGQKAPLRVVLSFALLLSSVCWFPDSTGDLYKSVSRSFSYVPLLKFLLTGKGAVLTLVYAALLANFENIPIIYGV
jgi:hypothetical protein